MAALCVPYAMETEDLDLFEEEDLATSSSSITDTKFDLVIGNIEDIIMEEEFQTMQHDFLEKYYNEFDDSEENKFIYTDIHKEYVSLVEHYLEEELGKRLPDFCMSEFSRQIMERKDELDGEIFEMLHTFTDFMSFKEMFLDFKAEKEGRTVDLSVGITVTNLGADFCMEGASFSLTGQSFPPNQH
ncbi:ADP-ribosylation factor-like protein 2-binding protein isoform X2 [Mya arenaria]|uniref:ADP-ribosylation factor-like protein 2-binding protein isoform X2 n=1 Tax=Mya arenaria TaxID=6604 RepID=UPI0022E8B1F1|nr:ADP-ribosylation factor-like protein 2-binding protein isoform X2 [Mya arenaria]XP_052816392.1 ADP-ribosylation factor-like protein 2-binding protein isoform X2 [Mya arenaria]XP_052818882.1 ADP-ribosylation factor-like protein 2-binding protein isoform X2 [Mya arenaria]XP_052818883.1 ADP-ribosylation factor-like protein 2-binding protein isoform X2 [Mya arenaria]